MEDNVLPGWFDGFADAVSAIGTTRFADAFLAALNRIALVDHLTILAWSRDDGLRAVGIASRLDLPVARSLTRDYVAEFHVHDPNFAELTRRTWARGVVVRRHDPGRLRTRAYQQRFYTTVGLVDKVSYIWHAGGFGFYVNLYRTLRTGRYATAEAEHLSRLARFVAALVRQHCDHEMLAQAMAGRKPTRLVERLVVLAGEQLTVREQAVCARMLFGMGTEGIAVDLGVKPATVMTFRKRAYAKLGISTQAELFALALRALPRMLAKN